MTEKKLGKTIVSDEGTVKFDFMTSLRNITAAQIVSNLWMNKNSLQDIVEFVHAGIRPGRRETSDSWRHITNNILAKVSELPLPKSMTEKLKNIVPVEGNSILQWIRYHECIINTNEYSAADQICNIKWTARGKIDYTQTAKNMLDDKDTGLSDDHRYKIACAYCLEDEIAVLAPNVVNQYYLDSVQIHMHPMVYFWTAHITGDKTELYKHYHDCIKFKNISVNGYIMQLLVNSYKRSYKVFNEVPIRYMWDKLSEEEKAKNISSLVKELGNQELSYTLLSSLYFELQQEVFKACSDTILFGILNDWLWGGYFLPVALHILDTMRPLAYLLTLKHVHEEMIKNRQQENNYMYNKYNYIFKQLWQESSRHLKDLVSEHENGKSLKMFVVSLSWERDMDVIELILGDLSAEKKKDIIFHNQSIDRCVDFIKKDKWDLLDKITKCTLSSSEDINRFKEKLKYRTYVISEYFLEQGALYKVENLMNWVFKSEEDKGEFRKKIAYVECRAALETLASNNDMDFTSLENHFSWCAKGDVEMINQFKAEIPKSYSIELYSKLIKDDKYDLLDQFLNWCFLHDQIKIAQFKRNLYKEESLMSDFGSLIIFLVRKDDSLKMLDKFIDWSFTNQQEVHEFKMWLLYPLEKNCSVCTDFLVENQFELGDKFVEWCVTSAEEICQFKKMLMLSKDFTVIFRIHFDKRKPDLPLLIKWFNPTEKIAEAFKKIYPQENCPNNFYELLDAFLQNRNSLLERKEDTAIYTHAKSGFENPHNQNSQEEV